MDKAEPIVELPESLPTRVDDSPLIVLVDPKSTPSAVPQNLKEELPIAEPAAEGIAEASLAANSKSPPDSDATEFKALVAPTAARRLAESLILFVSAILFLRAMAVEPFGVPTGSMSLTLIGNHKVVDCPRCGYRIRVGEPGKQHAPYPKTTCPNCGKSEIDLTHTTEIAGDRLLVDKNVYTLRRPRRWEPAVFRCPSDLTKPYVKRVIGLPGERIQVVDGDIYVDGRLARKSLSEALETKVPIYDMNFPPQPDGWTKRWVVENKLPPEAGEPQADPTLALAGKELRLDGTAATQAPVWINYKHHRFDDPTGVDREEVIRDQFVYNGPAGEVNVLPVHDFVVEFEVEIVGGAGALLCRLWDGNDQVVASYPVGANEEARLRHEGFGVVRSAPRKPLLAKKTYRVQMAFVDRRVSFAIDGNEPFPSYDLSAMKSRADVISPMSLGLKGINVVVRNLKISRDIYYRSSGRNAVDDPLQLGSDEYFMMGDNSTNSDDSRSWPIPGVPERNFLGKPFLLHQPSRITHLTFNGRERFFQSIDWSRIRFLR